MIFIRSFLHGDPHPGNILVSPEAEGRSKFSLVLLDHGIYKKIRRNIQTGLLSTLEGSDCP
ncbi:hypothetical protein VitviT2T_010146 [Vitis vinifera]|uniref:ABC1 atypical kinase-like domain-containing protein n=2 Tax=Vitis vinifera TaxID=29760 RepID=A0ABY9C7R7_VITVI